MRDGSKERLSLQKDMTWKMLTRGRDYLRQKLRYKWPRKHDRKLL